jgi:hypothetical protein
MKAMTMILAGGFGLAALASAAPAAAQYYPGYPAPGYGYPGTGYNNNVVGQVLGQILGYGQYPYGNYGYNAGADLSWSCEVRFDGRIRDIDVNRRSASWRGY